MLTALRTGVYFRFAILLAALASLCFVAPPAVLAFGHGRNTVDCMTHADMVDHGKLQHGTNSQDHDSAPASGHHRSCCGLFCMSALVIEGSVIEPVAAESTSFPARTSNHLSRLPERLDRPPISLAIV
jgi:hypothetical protein